MPTTERLTLPTGAVARTLECVLIAAGRSKTGLIFPPEVLWARAELFDAAPCFLDHACAADAGRPGGRSVRDLIGLFDWITWDDAARAVCGRLVLSGGHPWLDDLVTLFHGEPERLGLSADLTIARQGARVTDLIEVHSVDVVMNPAAGGRFLSTPIRHPPTPNTGAATMPPDPSERHALAASTRTHVVCAGGTIMPNDLHPTPTPVEAVTERRQEAAVSAAEPVDAATAGPTLEELSASVLDARLREAALPEPMARIARQTFAETGQLRAALSQVEGLRAAWASALEASAVRGLGASISPSMRTGVERLELAFERLMGLPETAAHRSVPRLSGIRELYDTLTGDWERHGVYRQDRVTLANATTSTMAEITRNVLNKVMLTAYEARQWWKPLVHEDDFPNMQQVRWLTVGGIGDLDTVTEGDAYTEKTWDDYAETAAFVKKGNYLGLTLEMIDRDDVGAVRALSRKLGYAANRTLSAAVAALFTDNVGVGPTLADTNPLFDAANHANLLTTALGADAWDAVVQAMFKQGEYHSTKRLGIRPKFCLVPIELEKTALTVFTSDGEPGTPNNDANVRRYSAQVITVPEWTDATDWAAAADPAELEGVCIGYRFGRAPELYLASDELMGSMFTNDEMRIKVRFVYAVGIGDYRALHKSNVA